MCDQMEGWRRGEPDCRFWMSMKESAISQDVAQAATARGGKGTSKTRVSGVVLGILFLQMEELECV